MTETLDAELLVLVFDRIIEITTASLWEAKWDGEWRVKYYEQTIATCKDEEQARAIIAFAQERRKYLNSLMPPDLDWH